MSIEALNWARRIFVGDAYGKSVLRAIADYADEHGYCFPSLQRLADDCDLSVDSVRRRIKLLEETGLIVTFRCWLDEHGRRNTEGRGRETSRDIRLPLDLVRTREMVESAPAEGEGTETPDDLALANSKGGVAGSEGYSPSQQLGAGSHTARGGVALQPPLEQPLNSHLKDSPPNPPAGGVSATEGLQGEAKELFEGFKADYPDSSTFVWAKAEPVFKVLTLAEQRHVRYAAAAYARQVNGMKRRPAIVQPRTFMTGTAGGRMFENFPAEASHSGTYPHGSDAAKAIAVAYDIDGKFEFFHSVMITSVGVFYRRKVDARLLALAKAPPRKDWVMLTRQQAGAWEQLLASVITANRNARLGEGACAPWPWPPKKDGSLYIDGADPPVVPELTDDDCDALAGERMR